MCDSIACLRGGLTRCDAIDGIHAMQSARINLLIELLSSIADADTPAVAADQSTAIVADIHGVGGADQELRGRPIRHRCRSGLSVLSMRLSLCRYRYQTDHCRGTKNQIREEPPIDTSI